VVSRAGRLSRQRTDDASPGASRTRIGNKTTTAGAALSQGGSAAMNWLLFLLAFAGALAVGFFGVLGLF
jgi:hypothetical protein